MICCTYSSKGVRTSMMPVPSVIMVLKDNEVFLYFFINKTEDDNLIQLYTYIGQEMHRLLNIYWLVSQQYLQA